MLDRELKKGSAELLIFLSQVEDQARHGCRPEQADRSARRRVRGSASLPVSAALPPREARWILGRWIEKAASDAGGTTDLTRPAPPSRPPAARYLARSPKRSTVSRESTRAEWPRRIKEEMRQHLDDGTTRCAARGIGHDAGRCASSRATSTSCRRCGLAPWTPSPATCGLRCAPFARIPGSPPSSS
jgi:hypothetical protein